MPPVVTTGGLRTMGVPMEPEMLERVAEVQRLLGVRSKAVAIRYLMLQGIAHLEQKGDLESEKAGAA